MQDTQRGYPIIEELNQTFLFPQNGNKRGIFVLLPHNYYTNTQKRYPVLYMHDAQNLYGYGPFGSWHIDRTLETLSHKGKGDVIVVAIEHAAEHRIEEFMPYKHKDINGQGGKTYSEFISTELKPTIDRCYRTLPDRMHTGMGGSSLGGLITIYSGIMFPHIFSKLLIFSPSLWAAPRIYFDAAKYLSPCDSDIYLYAGEAESKFMVPNTTKFMESLKSQGERSKNLTFNLSIDPKGHHNEARWGKEFPLALNWLFFRDKK